VCPQEVTVTAQSALESAEARELQSGERQVLELIATGAQLETILDTLCRVIDEASGLRSSIFLLNSAGDHLGFAAGPHIPSVWRKAVASFPVTITACGAAITRREQIISPDIVADRSYAGFEDAARQAQIRAAWSTPFFSRQDRPLGTFAVYSDALGPPSPHNLALVSRATHLASLAVEHHVAEQALREGEARFRQIAEHIREVFWMTTADFSEMLYVSEGYETLWGRTRESLVREPRSWMAAIHPNDRSGVVATIEAGRTREFDIEYRIVRPDGSMRWVRDRGFPIRDDAGRSYRVAGIAEDITERKQVEDQLKKNERLLAEAQRLAHIGSWNWNLATRTVTWSDELYRIFGLEPHEIDPGRDAMAFVDPQDRDAIMRAIDRTLETRQPYSFSYRIHRRDGSERILRSIGHLVTGEPGEGDCIYGSTHDITEQKQAEEALRRVAEQAREVGDAIPVQIWSGPADGTLDFCNEQWRAYTGLSQTELQGDGWQRMLHPDDRDRVLQAWRTSITTGAPYEQEERHRASDGTYRWFLCRGIPTRDARGHIERWYGANTDITDRKNAEEARKSAEGQLAHSRDHLRALAGRLMHAQDEERRRIAQMLHETTAQDLAALKMLLGRLNRTSDGLSENDRSLLGESVRLADRSMGEVRTLAYLLHPPFLDEAGLLSALRWYAHGFADRSGIRVDLDLPDAMERLPREIETTLFRVVQEGLINVHRHAHSPTASIRLRIAPEQLTLEIEDHGRGMAPDFVARLTRGTGPSGVGLAGMRERLKQIGGELDIESSRQRTIVRATVPSQSSAS
jgi:PAS domain S-box-containing protein